ncbi:MAG TPA: hypothetical protein VGJ16_03745 [Pirellulales bacterium]
MQSGSSSGRTVTTCPHCGNKLRVWLDSSNSDLVCPKCAQPFSAQAPNQPGTAPAAISEVELYEPEVPLRKTTVVPEEQMTDIGPKAGLKWQEVNWDAHAAKPQPPPQPDYLEAAKRQGLLRERPVLYRPRSTFLSDVFDAPWRGANLARWAAVSFGMSTTGVLFVEAANNLGLFTRVSGTAIMGLPLLLPTIVLGIVTCSLAAASFMALLQDTADGHRDALDSSLQNWVEWVFLFLGMVCLACAAAAIGFPFAYIEGVGSSAYVVAGLLLFPVFLLSGLEHELLVVPYSPVVLKALARSWDALVAFYLLSTATLALWAVPFAMSVRQYPFTAAIFSGPALAAVLFIYARLLGRLAWHASGKPLAEIESPQKLAGAPDSKAGAVKAKPRGKRRRLEFPDEAALEHLHVEGADGNP